MSFNSIEYLFFLPTVFLLYWLVFKKRNMQNVLLVVASYVFYAAWDWRCLFLITLTSFCSFASGLLFAKNAGWGRVIYVANFILNIGILCGAEKFSKILKEEIADMFVCKMFSE